MIEYSNPFSSKKATYATVRLELGNAGNLYNLQKFLKAVHSKIHVLQLVSARGS